MLMSGCYSCLARLSSYSNQCMCSLSVCVQASLSAIRSFLLCLNLLQQKVQFELHIWTSFDRLWFLQHMLGSLGTYGRFGVSCSRFLLATLVFEHEDFFRLACVLFFSFTSWPKWDICIYFQWCFHQVFLGTSWFIFEQEKAASRGPLEFFWSVIVLD